MRRAKYGNVKTAGFDSKKEAKRYQLLRMMERAGEISELECQVKFVLVPKNEKFRAVTYTADFRYKNGFGDIVVEDSKGVKTGDFIIRQKLMYHVHGIDVVCV